MTLKQELTCCQNQIGVPMYNITLTSVACVPSTSPEFALCKGALNFFALAPKSERCKGVGRDALAADCAAPVCREVVGVCVGSTEANVIADAVEEAARIMADKAERAYRAEKALCVREAKKWTEMIGKVRTFQEVPVIWMHTQFKVASPSPVGIYSKMAHGCWGIDMAELAADYNQGSFLDRWAGYEGWHRDDVVNLRTAFQYPEDWAFTGMYSSESNTRPMIDNLRGEGYVVVAGYLAYKEGGEWANWFHEMMPTGPDIAGYISRFSASCVMDVWTTVEVGEPMVEIDGEMKPLGSDGANWGWNIDHEAWATFRDTYGITSFQFTFATRDGKMAKGIMMPVKLAAGAQGPSAIIAPNCFKAGAKKLFNGKLNEDWKFMAVANATGIDEIINDWDFAAAINPDYLHGMFGIMDVTKPGKTQIVGWQWMENIPVNDVTVEVVKRRSLKAVQQVIDAGKDGIINKLKEMGGNIGIAIAAAEKAGFDPTAIMPVSKVFDSILASELWECFASLGVEGNVYRLIIDDNVPVGAFCANGIEHWQVGLEAVIGRSPCVHQQAIRALTALPLMNHHKLAGAAHIYMNSVDIARINGDDDGDKVFVTFDRDIVTLAKEAMKEHSDTIWAFEPTGESVPHTEMNEDGGKDWVQVAEKGPVGIAANNRSRALSLYGNGKTTRKNVICLVTAALQQASVDMIKKYCYAPLMDVYADPAAWTALEKNGIMYRNAPKAGEDRCSIDEAVSSIGNVIAKELKNMATELTKKHNGPTLKKARQYEPKVNPVAWKVHYDTMGNALDKAKVCASNWNLCCEKDGGYSILRPNNASLLHLGHDICAAEWNAHKEQFFAQKGVGLKALTADEVSISLLGEWRGEVSKQKVAAALAKVELVAKVRTAQMAKQKAYEVSLDGDSDVSSMANIQSEFTRQIRKLGAPLQWAVARSYEERAKDCYIKYQALNELSKGKAGKAKNDAAKALKESKAAKWLAWEILLFENSPFVDAMGIGGAKCNVIDVAQATDIAKHAVSAESLAISGEWCNPTFFATLMLDGLPTWEEILMARVADEGDLDEQHIEATGVPIVQCKACMMRIKMACSEAWRDQPLNEELVELADALTDMSTFEFWEQGKKDKKIADLRTLKFICKGQGWWPTLNEGKLVSIGLARKPGANWPED